jgi:hypothetical protein
MRSVSASRFAAYDTSSYVTPSAATALYAAGYRLAFRYARRDKKVNLIPDTSQPVSLSIRERDELLATGFKLSLVQFASLSLVPSAATGAQAGSAMAYNAQQLGFLPGNMLWCDVEWAQVPVGGATAVMAYINAWALAVVNFGFACGCYVGPNAGLTGDQWYSLPKVTAYWKSASAVPWVENRGFQAIQGLPIMVGGIEIDQDLLCLDNKNQLFSCLGA